MDEFLKEAIEMANDAVEIIGCKYEECFPYEKHTIVEDKDGHVYKVKIIIDY